MTSLSSRIREARRLADFTRAELARRVGVRPSAAVQWEQHNGTAPTIRNLIKIAMLATVSFEWLATGRGVPRPQSLRELPAVQSDNFAFDSFEEELLLLAREFPVKWREPFVLFLRAILRKKK